MSKFVMFVAALVAVLAGFMAFNLLIGVFGLNLAIVSLVAFTIFVVRSCFLTQPEEKEPRA